MNINHQRIAEILSTQQANGAWTQEECQGYRQLVRTIVDIGSKPNLPPDSYYHELLKKWSKQANDLAGEVVVTF